MKTLIISDLHANIEAVSALPTDFDQLYVLGDLVNYGPNPREVIEFVRKNATLVVRGNHDHAIGFDADPMCSLPYKAMAAEMAGVTRNLLSENDRAFLRGLPLFIATDSQRCYLQLCHATPSDPLFAYCPPDNNAGWERECHAVRPGYLLVGHTHLQFKHEIYGRIVVNPGSVGQPKSSAPKACFAVLENGEVTLQTVPYDFETTADKIRRLDLSPAVQANLIHVLRTGSPLEKPSLVRAAAGLA